MKRSQFPFLTPFSSTVRGPRFFWVSFVVGLAILGRMLVSPEPAQAQEARPSLAGLQAQIEALRIQLQDLQALLPLADFVRVEADEINGLWGPHVIFEGANVHIRSGAGRTADSFTGLGNLLVGYNETRQDFQDEERAGAHNLIVGPEHRYSSFGGFAAGALNTVSGPHASVSGGRRNTASAIEASVSGGSFNTASMRQASVSGGSFNTASARRASVSGGQTNTASGVAASISGGLRNTASAVQASVSGGRDNTASGVAASVSGGVFNRASNRFASVSGGVNNEASGDVSSVSGGRERTASGMNDWVAGGLFQTE